MPALVVADDVRAVYPTDRDDAAIDVFIGIALAFSDEYLVDEGLSSTILKELQRYLAAHFLFVTDAGLHASLRTEDVSETFTGSRLDPGLADSRWGRTALALDPTGTLKELSKPTLPADLRIIPREC